MSSTQGHKTSGSVSQNHKAQLANAYNELGKELSSTKVRVVGNYTLGKVIGEGAYGKVRMGTHRLTSTRVAIKQIPKAMSASLTREIHHHRQLHHPHVTQMFEVIATESSIWLVTELCCGGELFDYLVEKGRLAEDETRILFGQLCLAVAYLHENGIVHRDLKLENVLLDERCRVKLGDFGFTREFERGSFMETFCGTTGYASPEMLQGKKYQGPEVDVWSLGIILYCLLTGTLPFDDDDEDVMRAKIIRGDFEDPDWLSIESRDLIKNVLQKDVTKRLMIPQILAHPWFSTQKPIYEPEPGTSETSTLSTSDSLFTPGTSTTPTTPDEIPDDPFELTPLHRTPSETTLRKSEPLHLIMTGNQPETVQEEDDKTYIPTPPRHNSSGSSKVPPIHPVRTPARTKRRSVSSTLSDSASPTADKTPTPLPFPSSRDLDFASLLSTPTPIIFSTPVERELLNTLSALGFDTAQIVHSVLTDACDAAGAVWWMLKKKAEKRSIEEADQGASPSTALSPLPNQEYQTPNAKSSRSKSKKRRVCVGVQTDSGGLNSNLARSAPQLAFVPATPTFPGRPTTPPRPPTPTRSTLLSPSSSTIGGDTSSRSHPSTPASSLRDKEGKGRKNRAGSVSIMQRATTALEAAGLVRKKSSEGVREEKDREKERERDRERSKEMERRIASGEESRSSHGSSSSKLTKSPPLKPSKEYLPSTPPPSEVTHTQLPMDSPWVLADTHDSLSHHRGARISAPTPANTPGEMQHSHSAPNISETPEGKPTPGPRNRANLLTAFRLWFHEDRKGKRKENPTNSGTSSNSTYSRPFTNSVQPFGGTGKRRGSGSSGRFGPRTGHRHRPSVSSRRSSSVNSRRSSGTSVQMLVLDSPQIAARRSFGSHTPNSERGDYSSRPSSIRSFSMQQRHRKSPSASSAGSIHLRTASPMQKYHRRGGSGSSTTRVVRQVQTTPRPPHVRSNSATSSIHSPTSSRPASFYDLSENEGPRTTSPYKSRTRRSMDDVPRRPTSSSGNSNTTFVAQKRQGPFMSPINHGYGGSFGRSSWKKSWGLEPPGWQSRTAHLPIEVLAISPATEPVSIRDVFSGRQSLNLGDESDWVDEDDDIPAFAGGLGQMGTSASSSGGLSLHSDPPVTLSPAPRGHRTTKRVNRSTSSSGSNSITSSGRKSGHSPVERASPIPPDNVYETETRSGRRQLPAGRSGPAFRHAIQEEDEGEEE
ncbi:hypothetical protein BDZ94DRAFT_1188502 [Collybia nuda]|uniref:Protein kinase domain-containing protein n=1 Tax=Collybia nuda TaxID=64659 RepID=A0A9P5Y9N5_9AGAR|nr:hypothetical protein BDZ94DRAFT_1188502 [Collybia nuda]